MRTLEFEVKKQRLMKAQTCDFSGLVAGSVGYLKARFTFTTEDWNNCEFRFARFWIDDNEYAKPLDEHGECDIPDEVLPGDMFRVSVLGASSSGYKIGTNEIRVRQEVY